MKSYLMRTLSFGLVLLGTGIACRPDRPDDRDKPSAEEIRAASMVSEAVKKFNAVEDWEPKKLEFSIQLRRALIREDQRPILIKGEIHDIDVTSNGTFVDFRRPFNEPTIAFELSGNLDTIRREIQSPSRQEYAVIAQIQKIRKVRDFREFGLQDGDAWYQAEGTLLEMIALPSKTTENNAR